MATRTQITLTQTRLADGWWEGLLVAPKSASETVEAWHQDRLIDRVEVTRITGKTGQYRVRVPIPASVLTEGLQTVVLKVGGERAASFVIAAGAVEDGDLRAEINLLREELDLLKRAFRRHCAETAR